MARLLTSSPKLASLICDEVVLVPVIDELDNHFDFYVLHLCALFPFISIKSPQSIFCSLYQKISPCESDLAIPGHPDLLNIANVIQIGHSHIR